MSSELTVLKDLTFNSFKGFSEEKLPKKCFYRTLKNRTTGDDGKKLDGHISHVTSHVIRLVKKFEMYLTWKIWVIITIII